MPAKSASGGKLPSPIPVVLIPSHQDAILRLAKSMHSSSNMLQLAPLKRKYLWGHCNVDFY